LNVFSIGKAAAGLIYSNVIR